MTQSPVNHSLSFVCRTTSEYSRRYLRRTSCKGLAIFFGPLLRIGYERQGCPRAIDVVLHCRRPAQPDRADNFSVHLNGKSSTPCCHPRQRGDAGQKRRVALDKVEKLLRGDAEQSRVSLILSNL